MAKLVEIPWGAWFGDETRLLRFPDGWQVHTCAMHDAPDVGAAGIAEALAQPIGTASLRELAERRRSAVIVVDDLTRPTPAARLLPIILAQLDAAGIPTEEIRIIIATGAQRPLLKSDLLKKLGPEVVARCDVVNHHPYENLEDLGISSRGTAIRINRFFLNADMRIGVGCITPHDAAGFSGGAKIIMPGLSDVEVLARYHGDSRFAGAVGDPDGSEYRADIEEIVERCGLDIIVNVVPTGARGVAGVFAGEMITAHRAGVRFARSVFATALPTDLVDIVVANAYPHDQDFLQANRALTILESARRAGNRILRPGGTTVITTASPEGRGYHALYGPGGRLSGTGQHEQAPFDRMHSAGPVYFSPHLSPGDAAGLPLRTDWDALIAQLLSIHGPSATVAVFPTGPLQLAE